ncbi:ABC transporter ATP-binding protein/permease [Escherichia coli]|uniref:ABC transporter ATP-binding protein/permease n=1 Tax=Escherichia coli TaxID=562 RepID=UPI00183207C8|nr:ABC transporter ATP-binding protein/permease [Escherichia coli]EEY9449754.1 ABC transporter ATP-binding protein/permease [Escherichia coli]EFN7857406.1 ABC transporter ATP-binding protein/permease [Escherichia coli]EFN9855711.1 ABC transporter ATP-binding protein/permease [Escherichia coli]MBB9758945.1 ABC transporter ATP-binding protein/permease [Escherichia coli]GIP82582.1 multidrug ABC transporter permease/ATPase [Escherichia coli]
MITILITFCMLIAKYLCLLKPFWLRKNNKTSVLLIIIILAMILGVVKIQVWLNDWNNDFFNALSQKETDKLWQLVLWFPALLGIFVLISVNKTWLIKLLTIRWREWLTDYYLNRWFADKNYYFTQIYGEHKNTDNPDQRIAEDILLLISKTLSLSFGFIQSLSMLITFTVILWQSAGTLSFTVGGTEWNIQGYMVYTVVLIVIGGTLFTHKVGKRIRPLNVEKQRSEATFRTNLVQHNKQAELIALSNAESLQRQELSDNFHTIKENWHRLMNRQRWLDYWQNIYSRSLSVLPYFLLLPQFISGQINLGGLMKSRQAFMLVSNNLSWFIYKYDELAELAAVIDRLYEFHQLTEQRPTNKPKNCQHAVQVANASIRTPDNKIILENLNFHVSPGKWLLLKEIICKALPLPVDDKSLSEVLHQVGLGKLAARIHDHDRWGDILSSGEKQRIALARLILRRPKWIFLDETTSHLEEQEAIRLLRLVREKLPTSGVIMVTHQPGVWNLADDICDISTVL